MSVLYLRMPQADGALILRGGDQFGNGCAKYGMMQARRKLSQRNQNEAALVQARVRDFHFLRPDDARAIE